MTNETKQTAVEWLEKELRKNENIRWRGVNIEDIFNQALAMEKEQHEQTWLDSTAQFENEAYMPFKKLFKNYYNETYGGDK